jgi:hypothetical protein
MFNECLQQDNRVGDGNVEGSWKSVQMLSL